MASKTEVYTGGDLQIDLLEDSIIEVTVPGTLENGANDLSFRSKRLTEIEIAHIAVNLLRRVYKHNPGVVKKIVQRLKDQL